VDLEVFKRLPISFIKSTGALSSVCIRKTAAHMYSLVEEHTFNTGSVPVQAPEQYESISLAYLTYQHNT
jgi:hypothetical protein